jgi:hypothetical protein
LDAGAQDAGRRIDPARIGIPGANDFGSRGRAVRIDLLNSTRENIGLTGGAAAKDVFDATRIDLGIRVGTAARDVFRPKNGRLVRETAKVDELVAARVNGCIVGGNRSGYIE